MSPLNTILFSPISHTWSFYQKTLFSILWSAINYYTGNHLQLDRTTPTPGISLFENFILIHSILEAFCRVLILPSQSNLNQRNSALPMLSLIPPVCCMVNMQHYLSSVHLFLPFLNSFYPSVIQTSFLPYF